MTCRLCILTPEGKRKLVGLISLENGRIKGKSARGYKETVKEVLSTSYTRHGKRLSVLATPELWLKNLPIQYHGSYFWAEAVKGA